ncbi:hypothetical protein M0R45_017478 [Rubus argutus]|uniref:BZIP domain-containing protein n=1 Tax=Rubus argutus TaxID=59490 RepID=A0AAW1XW80_RUBAR
MEGFSRPPLPPPPSSSPSLRSHNSDQGMSENLIDRALAKISETEQYPEIQQLENTDLLEISQDELLDRAKDKKFKRVLATREYSKRYHLKQLQHIGKLETEAKVLEAEIAVASPRIRFTQRKNMLLRAENDSIRQKIATVSGKLMLKEAEHEDLQSQVDSIKQLFEVMKMQQAEAAFNPLAGPGYIAFNPPDGLGYQASDPSAEPSYQPLNPPAGLGSETVDFGQFYEPAPGDQFNIEPPGLDDQFIRDPARFNHMDEPVGYSQFNDELAAIVAPHITANKDNSDDSQTPPGSSSDQLM